MRHITPEQGLSQSYVNCIFQDAQGFMWFGTQDGLNKYDGKKITVYNSDPDDPESLSGNTIVQIIQDKQGRLWIGTENGLNIYTPQTNKFKRFKRDEKQKNSLSNNSINSLCLSPDNLIWVSTDNGLNEINPATFEVKSYFIDSSRKQETNKNQILRAVNGIKSSDLIVIVKGGIYNFDKLNKSFNLISDSSLVDIASAAYDGQGKIYVNISSSGIKVFNIKSMEIKDISSIFDLSQIPDKKKFQILSAYKTSKGISYLGTDRLGLIVLDTIPNKITIINAEGASVALLNNKVQSVFCNVSNQIWLGTELGVDQLRTEGVKFNTFTNKDFEEGAMKSNQVTAILEDDGKFFFGTSNGGLAVLDQRTAKGIILPKGINYGSQNGVLSLLKDKNGHYWIGTWGDGLVELDLKANTFKQFNATNSFLHGSSITSLAEHGNCIWIGSFEDGLYKIDKTDQSFAKYTVNNGLSSNSIYCTEFDSDHKLWIGTNGGGVNIYDLNSNQIEVMKHDEAIKNSLSSNVVNCIFHDPQNIIWIGTENGLNRFDPVSRMFTRYYVKDGLPNNYIYSILPGNIGSLWISTNKGISRFNTAIENVEGAAFTNYGPKDGLQGEEFNQGAYYKGKDGSIFFGGLNGVSVINPNKIVSSGHMPSVYITSYKRFSKEVSLDTAISFKRLIEVKYNQNAFAFEFSAPDFDDPSRNKYSWKMEGLENADEDWSAPTTRNFAEYPQLNPGEYTFRVRAANSDGKWNEIGTYIHIVVNSPWYKTTAAYIGFSIIIVLGAWGYSQFQTRRVAKQKRVLERMVEKRTLQLAEKNRDITSSIEYARKIQDAILPPLTEIYYAFSECFILYKPRDIVSGDFYWFYEKGAKKIIAIVDCTGHGVPGAFMSMIGHNLLNQIVIENEITSAAEILNQLHLGVKNALKQEQAMTESKDGMDISLCVFDRQEEEIEYAGAYRPLYIVNPSDGGKIKKIVGDKFPVGGSHFGAERSFTCNKIPYVKGQLIYMFTDGFADQFGGPSEKKFMIKRFDEMLLTNKALPLHDQAKTLENTFDDWKKSLEQVDDVLVLGIKL